MTTTGDSIPGGFTQGCALGADSGDAVEHEVGKKGVEVGEVPVQDTLGAACFGSNRPAGQRVRPVSQQDALGGSEQLLAHIT